MMAHALKVQAEIHQVPEYHVTAEELEGISLTQTDPDFTRGINPDEFARGSGSDSLADDLDLILTGASPAISRDRRVPSSPPRSGNGVIEISTTPRPARPQFASVTPVLKVCDAPRRAKRRRLVSKTASLVKRLFTDSVESPACSTREGGCGSQSVINETEAETESDNGPEPNQEAERSRRERQSPTRPLFKRRFPQADPAASVSNQEARPERARRLRIAPPLRQRRDSGILRLAEITSDLIRDLIRDYSATFSNACEKGFV
ncbi:uncharacterized protein LOC128319346 [Pangasianodon hypophthalmus]|uniref:uncharacterized protein LOC117597183 n=1 Tax=Pangasianodon hypophthalmus TaxID=310915 RepID=UPI002307E047|nr:uncharacterized protein LOC117597183 [Pangasianodon hypophthalmus]XP_053091788.1 uncharacterized protein LOC128318682 [Pangasianodon hypophthalmus]XP_053094306.1 uncharacterized protein LOC128319346 [Pangasianodon hypophthalmus]